MQLLSNKFKYRKVGRMILLAGLISTMSLLFARQLGQVSAHAAYVKSSPAANASLPAGQPPNQVQVWYSEEVELKYSKLEVVDKSGTRIDKGDVRLAPGDAKSMIVSLKTGLTDGSYTVLSTAASAVDGHIVVSSFAFLVGAGSLPSGTSIFSSPIDAAEKNLTDTSVSGTANPASISLRWLNYLGGTALVGGLLFYLVVWRSSVRKLQKKGRIGAEIAQADAFVTRRTQFLISMSLAILSLGWLGWLFYQTGSFSEQNLGQLLGFGGGRGPSALADFLFDSRYGLVWLGRLILIIITALAWFLVATRPLNRLPKVLNKIIPTANLMPQTDISLSSSKASVTPPVRLWWVIFGLGITILLTTSLVSHAAALPDFAFAAIVNDWLHLMGTSFWIGGLFFISLTLAGAVKALVPGSGDRTRLLSALAPTFSQMAILSVALLGITGAISAYLQLGNLDELWNTTYGVTLTVKLGLFAFLLILGFINQQVIIPKIRGFMRVGSNNTEAGPGSLAAGKVGLQFRRSLWAEAVLGVLVLLSVGVLLNLAPPKSLQAGGNGVQYFQQEAGDLRIALAFSPAQLGDNTFEVSLIDRATGQPVTKAEEVRLTFGMVAMAMGEPQLQLKSSDPAKGRYLAQGSVLSMTGDWDVAVLVRREGKDDVRVPFKFKIK